HQRVVGVFFQLRDFDGFDGTAHLAQNVLEQVMGHGSSHFDAFDFRGHGRRFQKTDPDRQVKFVIGIFQNDDGRLCYRIYCQSAHRHLYGIFPLDHAISPCAWELETRPSSNNSPNSEVAVAPVMRTGTNFPISVSGPSTLTIRFVSVRPMIWPFFNFDLPST